jgi:hypothetical protein
MIRGHQFQIKLIMFLLIGLDLNLVSFSGVVELSLLAAVCSFAEVNDLSLNWSLFVMSTLHFVLPLFHD